MALELKYISSQNAVEDSTAAMADEDKEWTQFSNTYIRKAEERWTKKLEDYDLDNEANEEEHKSEEEAEGGDHFKEE